MKKKVDSKEFHNLIILDESGSMDSICKQALSGANETIMTIRNAQEQYPELKQMLTFVTFDSHGGGDDVRIIFDALPIAQVRDLTDDDYSPNGCTPLYDAMGVSLANLQKKVSKDDYALVTIITDGLENASHEYSGKAIKNIVGLLRDKGWIFNYIGANQDAVEVASDLNIDRAMNFDATPQGTAHMFGKVQMCLMSESAIAYQKIRDQAEEKLRKERAKK